MKITVFLQQCCGTDSVAPEALKLPQRDQLHIYVIYVIAALNLAHILDRLLTAAHIDIIKVDKSLADKLCDEDELPQRLQALSAILRVMPLRVIVEGGGE
jgi:hypothetical protein